MSERPAVGDIVVRSEDGNFANTNHSHFRAGYSFTVTGAGQWCAMDAEHNCHDFGSLRVLKRRAEIEDHRITATEVQLRADLARVTADLDWHRKQLGDARSEISRQYQRADAANARADALAAKLAGAMEALEEISKYIGVCAAPLQMIAAAAIAAHASETDQETGRDGERDDG